MQAGRGFQGNPPECKDGRRMRTLGLEVTTNLFLHKRHMCLLLCPMKKQTPTKQGPRTQPRCHCPQEQGIQLCIQSNTELMWSPEGSVLLNRPVTLGAINTCEACEQLQAQMIIVNVYSTPLRRCQELGKHWEHHAVPPPHAPEAGSVITNFAHERAKADEAHCSRRPS